MSKPPRQSGSPDGPANEAAQPDWSRRSAQILALLAVIVLIVIGVRVGSGGDRTLPAADDSVEAAGFAPGEVPPPYHYDEPNNRYWHPEHAHWHPGRPPAGFGPPAAPPQAQGPTPSPYYYDEPRNRYWHPDHGQWHPGRPPEGAASADGAQPAPEGPPVIAPQGDGTVDEELAPVIAPGPHGAGASGTADPSSD